MKKSLFLLVCLLVLGGQPLLAQLITVTPQYPTVNDTVTIVFDATQGDAGVQGISPIYMHTGLLTKNSLNPSDWQYIVADWGTQDSTVLMTPLGNDRHQIKFHIASFYGLAPNEKVYFLNFVFRDAGGNNVGKEANGSDIYYPIYEAAPYTARFVRPLMRPQIYSLNDPIEIIASSPVTSAMTIYHNGQQIQNGNGTTLSTSLTASTYGKNYLVLEAQSGSNFAYDTLYYIVEPPVTVADPPAGTRDGINYINNSSVILQMLAPQKNSMYAWGDFSDWELDPAYFMNRNTAGDRFWVEINGLNPAQEYRFQYVIDQSVRVADPFCDKVLDPFNDNGINSTVTYPNLIDYPDGKTTEFVGILETGQTPFNWQVQNFFRPLKEDLVIYELLPRDFVSRHDWNTILDTLDYLENLGVNAIELMPVMEFDGNRSWGYGPAFYFAPDKYYGPKNTLKQLIDECHQRGMAIILDVVPNHAFGNHSYVKMYFDKNANNVTANNPFFNDFIPHPFGFDYDWNHDSPYTQYFMDSLYAHWVREYKVDGYRIDLSKGLTNTFTGSNIGAWSAYDQSRVNLIYRYVNRMWGVVDPFLYVILEHFADNNEEQALANGGMMLWGNANVEFSEAVMGYQNNSDFGYDMSWQARGFNAPHLVGYMESHDEERVTTRALNFGNSSGSYDVTNLETALDRMGMAAAFFFSIPGPKMIWQFGEMGYDVSIDFGGDRTAPKPIRWNYFNEYDRQYLYRIYAAMIDLKKNNATWKTTNYGLDLGGTGKRMWLSHQNMDAVIVGNFDVVSFQMTPSFQHTGTWYDYFTGQSLQVNDVNMLLNFDPGEYHIYTDQPLPPPNLDVIVGNEQISQADPSFKTIAFPNPFTEEIRIGYELESALEVEVEITDGLGRVIRQESIEHSARGSHYWAWDGKDSSGAEVAEGYYIFKLRAGDRVSSGKIIKN